MSLGLASFPVLFNGHVANTIISNSRKVGQNRVDLRNF